MRMAFSIFGTGPTIPHPLTCSDGLASCGNAHSALCVRSAKTVLDDLARRVGRQLVQELYIARHLVSRHSVATPGDQLVSRWPGDVGPGHHERLADLTHPVVGNADHCGLCDGGMLCKEAL